MAYSYSIIPIKKHGLVNLTYIFILIENIF